jgi:hypothetical protein
MVPGDSSSIPIRLQLLPKNGWESALTSPTRILAQACWSMGLALTTVVGTGFVPLDSVRAMPITEGLTALFLSL